MQTRNRLFDDLAKVANSAAGIMAGLKDEIEKLRNRLGGTDGGANIRKLLRLHDMYIPQSEQAEDGSRSEGDVRVRGGGTANS